MFPAKSRRASGKKYRVRLLYIMESAAKVQDHLIYRATDVSGAHASST